MRRGLVGASALIAVTAFLPATALAGGKPRVGVPAHATAGSRLVVVVTATTKKGKRNRGFRGLITITSNDPQGIAPPKHRFTRSDQGRFRFRGLELRTAGNRKITVRSGKRSNSKIVVVAPAAPDQLEISPPSAAVSAPAPSGVQADFTPIAPGSPQTSQTYTAGGSDRFGNALGDLTSTAIWTISPDGSCTGSACSPGTPGAHTVTATIGDASSSVPMSVDPLASTYTMTCRGEHYDVNQSLGDGCEVTEPNPGQGTSSTPLFIGTFDCGTELTNRIGSIISDSRVHTNPTVLGFDSNVGAPGEFYKLHVEDTGFCTSEYDVHLVASGGAASPSDCYRLTVSWHYFSGSAGTGSTSSLFSGNIGTSIQGELDSDDGLVGDDSADLLIGLEALCAPPRNEQVNFQLQISV